MIRLAVRAPSQRAELVLAALLELAPAGVEQVEDGGETEFAIYGAAGEVPELGEQRALLGGVEVEVRSTEVDDDWAERWREFHRPVEIGGRLRVRPPWFEPVAGFEDVVIDPGRAFGTAAHPTTRMCCELLLAAADRGEASGSLVDLGAGSGVLAILAARLGWQPVIAVDHEIAAIEAVTTNAEANGVGVEVWRLDLRREGPPTAPTVVANLTSDLLGQLANAYTAGTVVPALLICSGMIEDQVGELLDPFGGCGLEPRSSLDESGWVALALSRSDGRVGE